MPGLMHFLFIAALVIQTNTLVLRTGYRIDVDGSVKVDAGRVLFRSGGALYSVAQEDVDLDATRAAGVPISVRDEKAGKLRVSPEEKQRLIKELEQNHNGTAAAALELPPGPSAQERAAATQDEWTWKRAARAYEEAIRQAQENLDLLRNKATAIRAHISGLLGLGYTPNQFSYDTTLLHNLEEQIPQAEMELQRAQRAYDQFKDDARRQGVPPGYLR